MQGSPGLRLGPFLFLLYINDIAEKFISLSRLFADDTSMSARSHSNDELKETLNHDLSELIEFSFSNLLTLASRRTLPSIFGVKCKNCSAGTSIC